MPDTVIRDPVAATNSAGSRRDAALEGREVFCGQQKSSLERGGACPAAFGKEDEEREDDVRRLAAFASSVLVYLIMASVALAQEPTQSGYGGTGGNIQGDVEGGGGSLPFTGLDLLLLVGAGVLLLAAGFALRRVGRVRS
jgi:hypothetical protein